MSIRKALRNLQATREVADRFAAGAAKGRPVEEMVGDAFASVQLGDAKRFIEDNILKFLPPAHRLNPADVAEFTEKYGRFLSERTKRLLARSADPKATVGLQSRAAAREVRALLRDAADLEFKLEHRALARAAERLPQELRTRVAQAIRDVPIRQGAEEYATVVAKHLRLNASEAEALLRAVRETLCESVVEQLIREFPDAGLARRARHALEMALATPVGNPLDMLKGRLRDIVGGGEAGEVLLVVLDAAQGAVRKRLVAQLLEILFDGPARQLLSRVLDEDGFRRLLVLWASYGKEYTVRSMRGGLEGVIGMILESSRFVADAAAQAANGRLAAVAKGLADVGGHGISVTGPVRMHFDVRAPGLKSDERKKATDVLGTYALGRNGRSVEVIGSAVESKGLTTVGEGLEQATAKLRQRYRKGSTIVTERGTFVVGEDLFLTVEDALRALGAEDPGAILKAIGRDQSVHAAVVIAPRGARVSAELLKRFGERGAQLFEHPEGRDFFERAAAMIAPRLHLSPRGP